MHLGPASVNDASVARGPTISAVIDIDHMPLPADIDSLLIAELGVQNVVAEFDEDTIAFVYDNMNTVLPTPIMEAGALSGCILAVSFGYALQTNNDIRANRAKLARAQQKNIEGVSLFGDVGV